MTVYFTVEKWNSPVCSVRRKRNPMPAVYSLTVSCIILKMTWHKKLTPWSPTECVRYRVHVYDVQFALVCTLYMVRGMHTVRILNVHSWETRRGAWYFRAPALFPGTQIHTRTASLIGGIALQKAFFDVVGTRALGSSSKSSRIYSPMSLHCTGVSYSAITRMDFFSAPTLDYYLLEMALLSSHFARVARHFVLRSVMIYYWPGMEEPQRWFFPRTFHGWFFDKMMRPWLYWRTPM